MSGKSRYEDVLRVILERPISFTDFEPRGVPGYMSNIAHVFGCSENQTSRLLAAVDTLAADDQHYFVDRVPTHDTVDGTQEDKRPRKYQVTVSTGMTA